MSAMNYTQFSLVRDINGYNGFGLPFSLNKYSAILGANTDTTLTIPSTCPTFLAIFSYQTGVNVWVALNATAAQPAGATFAATTSELNPTARYVKAGDVIHFNALDDLVNVGVTLYGLQ